MRGSAVLTTLGMYSLSTQTRFGEKKQPKTVYLSFLAIVAMNSRVRLATPLKSKSEGS